MRRRIYIAFGLFVTLLIGILSKMASVVLDQSIHSVGLTQGSKTVEVANVRGTIYDRHLKPMVNQQAGYFVSCVPNNQIIQSLRSCLSSDSYQNLLKKSEDRVPLAIRLERKPPNVKGIHAFCVPIRYGNTCMAPQLLGYLDGSGQEGLSGIEKAYNDVLLSHSGNVEVTYTVTGAGDAIEDAEVSIKNTVNHSVGGVALTLDCEVQEAVDSVAREHLKKGAVVVLDAENGDVLAMGSYPSFHLNNIEATLEQSDGPLVNRALALYDCGSIFKIVTSMAALENGVPVERCYHCPGKITIDGNVFHCHHRNGHGPMNMTMAFAKSCNVYYIQLAQEIGANALLSMTEKLGFRQEIRLADGVVSPQSVLPDISDLSALAALANFSFGQGELMISPLQAARLTAVLTANGTLWDLGVVLGLVKNNREIEYYDKRGGETIVSAATVNLMRRMMQAVVMEGTGVSARSPYVLSAGKTGTAETGQINVDGSQVVQSWFTGYFPAECPRYVVTVLAEDAQNTGNQATKVFCEISNKLYTK